ncbi:hypothetical protein OHC33_008504 [Knufia fluminis]|uniref:Zinc finger Mcm10/DnaG-type domain-containing protein n=1 Tax=Knufia fluminis TaxID=191047 RepID=A0AAN8F3L2_9EURO|nr:hypothetical protein OHC33_008504 [Knufia fluminis]
MTGGEQWPPKSPLKALLSSPSGRKKYREYQDLGGTSTSPNKLLGSPSLLEKLRAAREDRDHEILQPGQGQAEEDEEDEETLQLKLQAIEAKLKLKKLQQQKSKDAQNVRPQSSNSAVTQPNATSARLEVALSPTKRAAAPALPKSPSRVVLGIDKGLNAADVSLRRAKTINGSPTKKRIHHVESRSTKPAFPISQSSSRSSAAAPTTATKSFSERMAETRDREQGRERKQSAVQSARSSHFKFDKKEMEGYHIASNPQSTPSASQSSHYRQVTSTSDREKNSTTGTQALKHSHSMPAIRATSPSQTSRQQSSLSSSKPDSDGKKGDPSLYEGFSNTHLSTRILPHTFLKRTLPEDQFTIYTLPKLLKSVTSPDYQIADDVTDYVIFGIIARKSGALNHKPKPSDTNTTSSADWEKKWNDGTSNKQKFIILTLTDLKWTIDLFLFDTAVPRYHRLTPGTLIAILNPAIMPPKKGRENTGAFSLAIHDGEDQILEIGTAKHLSYCSAKKRDGSACGDWVDGSKTSICEFHLNAQLTRTRSKRSGINNMTSFGADRDPQQEKSQSQRRRGFDHESQSFYYAVGGTKPNKTQEQRWSFAPTGNSSLSTAKLLDSNPGDDPFVAEGQMAQRDKEDRMRKRMAAMQKEHEIAKRLGKISAGAGAEYMRQRTGDPNEKGVAFDANSMSSRGVTKADIMADRPGESKKRAADSVRLSPVKKRTRFVTEKGIRVAGRESLGGAGVGRGRGEVHDEDDDDDDLDIV